MLLCKIYITYLDLYCAHLSSVMMLPWFLNRELVVNFELYLRLTTDKTTGSESSPPKYIQCIFAILEEALTRQVTENVLR